MPPALQVAVRLRYHEQDYLKGRRGAYKTRWQSLCQKQGTCPCKQQDPQ